MRFVTADIDQLLWSLGQDEPEPNVIVDPALEEVVCIPQWRAARGTIPPPSREISIVDGTPLEVDEDNDDEFIYISLS